MSPVKAKILVIDDEVPIRKFLRISLTAAGYGISEASKGSEALLMLEDAKPDLIILDLGLPDVDGQELITAIRSRCQAPVIVLSVRGEEHEKVAALDAGANDYVTKPFAVGELLARVRASLRSAMEPGGLESRMEINSLSLDSEGHQVRLDDQIIKLTPREFALLEFLMRHAGKVLTHRHLLREIWGDTHEDDKHYLRIYIRQLRMKLGDDPVKPKFIANEPGIGYRFIR